jgi:seryl-tRNA(Sec) selenium transferase
VGELVIFAILYALVLWRTSETRTITRIELEELIRNLSLQLEQSLQTEVKDLETGLGTAFHIRARNMEKHLASILEVAIVDPKNCAFILSYQKQHGVPTLEKVQAELAQTRINRGNDSKDSAYREHNPAVQGLKALLSILQKFQ